MTQDNIQTDTPQAGANEHFQSLEESVFSDSNTEGSTNISDIFNTAPKENTESAPVPEQNAFASGQPELSNDAESNETLPIDNDAKRYAYWQSQADKYKNELDQIKATQPQVAEKPIVQPQEVPTQKVDDFPAPPERPGRPRNFSREEAYTDPSSESARYLDAKEDWDEQMTEYTTLHTQYQNAVLQDRFNAMENQRVEEAKKQEAAQIASKQQLDIANYVTGHHGMSEQEAHDFMSKMSDPASITVDNLVQLYRMQQGNAVPQQNPAPAEPSQSFQQTKNAQQVPSPMGVMPSGQSNVDGRSMEDKMMDSMVGNFNSKNPWK